MEREGRGPVRDGSSRAMDRPPASSAWAALSGVALTVASVVTIANPWHLVVLDRFTSVAGPGLVVAAVLFGLSAYRWAERTWVGLGVTLALLGVLAGALVASLVAAVAAGPNPRLASTAVEATSPSGELVARAVEAGHDEPFWWIELEAGAGLSTRQVVIETTMRSPWGRPKALPHLRFVDESTLVMEKAGCEAVVELDGGIGVGSVVTSGDRCSAA